MAPGGWPWHMEPRKCQRLGQNITAQRTTQQEGKPRGWCVTPLLPHDKVPQQIPPRELWRDRRASAPLLGPWAPGCTDNTLQVGGLAGLAPATRSSSNWTHLFLLRACSAPLPGHTVQGQLTPPSQEWGHRLNAGHWVCYLPGQVAASLSSGTHFARPRTNREVFLGRAWRCRLGLFSDMSQIFPFLFSCLSGPADTPSQLILHCLPTLAPTPGPKPTLLS